MKREAIETSKLPEYEETPARTKDGCTKQREKMLGLGLPDDKWVC